MSVRRSFLFFLFSAILVSGCSQTGSSPFESHPAVRAEALVGDSFGVDNSKDRSPAIFVLRSALNKEFLLQAAVAKQGVASTGNAMKSRVVSFAQFDDRLYMTEATQGHVVSNDIPTTLVLASFRILKEDGQKIFFDFNEGMSNIFMAEEWYASDDGGKAYSPSFTSLKAKNSRVLSATLNGKNEFAIRQVAQLAITGGFSAAESNPSIEARYYLSPYRPDPDYSPMVGGKFKQMGFFEIQPQLIANGAAEVYVSRWSTKKPIVYAVSANTPQEYKQAVKDGILYWNRAFGKNIVEVVEAPAGVTAPDMNYNVVQWVPYDMAGSAYADGQMDPRTGQIMHAQVYLTSAFAFIGKQRARALLKTLRDTKPGQPKKTLGLEGMHQHALCDYDVRAALMTSLENLLDSGAGDAEILRVSQDFIRSVTAHEIGHTLGLRHNFAGSLATQNYPLTKRPQIFKDYAMHDHVEKDVTTTSTVMDYLNLEEDTLAGYVIRKSELPALEYDSKAIAGLYEGKNYKYGEIPLFCTDTDLRRFADCKQFDSGTSLVEMAAAGTPQKVDALAYSLLESYIAAKAPMLGTSEVPVEEVGFEPDTVAEKLFASRKMLISSFASKSTRLLTVFRSFPYVGPANLDTVKEKERESLAADLKKWGGMEKVLEVIPAQQAGKLKEQFQALLANPENLSGVGLAGQKFEFTAQDVQQMSATVEALSKLLPTALAKADLDILAEAPAEWKVTNTELGDNLALTLADRVKEYVFTRTGEKANLEIEFPTQPDQEKADAEKNAGVKDDEKEKPKTRTQKVSLAKFFYKLESRKKAAELLTPGSEEENIDWGVRERNEHKKNLATLLNDSIGCGDGKGCLFEKIKPEEVKLVPIAGIPEVEKKRLEKAVTRWFIENKAVLEAFK